MTSRAEGGRQDVAPLKRGERQGPARRDSPSRFSPAPQHR